MPRDAARARRRRLLQRARVPACGGRPARLRCRSPSSCGRAGSARFAASAPRSRPPARARRDRRPARDQGARGAAAARTGGPRTLPRREPQAGDRDRADARRAQSRRAARGGVAGRLQEVPGIGPETEQKLRAALAQDRPAGRRTRCCCRARALTHEIAESLGAEPAGDVRRFGDRREQLAVVTPAEDRRVRSDSSRRCRRSSRSSSATSGGPSASPSTACRWSSSFRSPEVRVPRSSARPARVRTSTRSSRCQTARTRRGLRRPGHPVLPAGAPRGAIPGRAAAARRHRGHPR